MRSYEEIEADVVEPGPPFANGTEWEIWADRWCWHPCKKDRNEDCPLIMVSLVLGRPKEWRDATDRREASGRYECTEFEPDDNHGDGAPADPGPWPQPVAELDGPRAHSRRDTRAMSQQEGFYRNLIHDGEIDHAAWLRARAEGGFAGTCRRCNDYLIPLRPHEHAGRTDYAADCRNPDCGYTLVAPGGRVMRSARRSERAGKE